MHPKSLLCPKGLLDLPFLKDVIKKRDGREKAGESENSWGIRE